MYMPSYSKNAVILVRYLFSDLSNSKVRSAVVVSAPHPSQDVFIIPLTSKTTSLLPGGFILAERSAVGLNVATAVKRGTYIVQENLVIKEIGVLAEPDAEMLEQSIQSWLGM